MLTFCTVTTNYHKFLITLRNQENHRKQQKTKKQNW